MLTSGSKWCLSFGVAAVIVCCTNSCITAEETSEEIAPPLLTPLPDLAPPWARTVSVCERRIWGGDAVVQSREDLEELSGHTTITGRLTIIGSELMDLQGLDCLREVGALYVLDNEWLTSLAGLGGLVSIEGDLVVERNRALPSLAGVGSLLSVGGDMIIEHNASLQHVDGPWSLELVGGDLVLSWNPSLDDVSGLGSVKRVGGLWVHANPSLTSLEGFSCLEQVLGILVVQHNPHLCHLGLGALVGVGQMLRIVDNPSLPSCEVDALVSRICYPDLDCDVTAVGNDDDAMCE